MHASATQCTVAAVQMNSGPEVTANLAQAGALVARAADAGAALVVLPENFALMGRREADKLAARETPGHGPIQDFLAGTARQHRIYLVGGTLPMATDDPARVRAASLVYDPGGACLARYDKMHLFDVAVGSAGERYRESASIAPGEALVTVDTPLGCLGLAVCYDLRFPELFRALVGRGVELLLLPSAFTETTGRAHWEVLLRARAIENLCYVLAPAQCGAHASGRRTYGHSLIVDPWGEVLAHQTDDRPGVISATLDLAHLRELRARFPALEHRRLLLS